MTTAALERGFVSRDPEIVSGAAVFPGTRVFAETLVDYLAAGHTLDEFLDDFPSVRRDQASAQLEFLREMLPAE